MKPWKNQLYFGDNLRILREEIPDEYVDLVYLDPPFNSNANYNVLFSEKSGEKSAAQIAVFTDSWTWSADSESAYHDVALKGGKLSELVSALRGFLGTNDMMAYVTMMAVRLVELRRVLKPTGTIYLHCDPTASHYLKLVLDAIFGTKRFLNEITWRRSSAHSDTKQGMKRCGRIRDVLLVYSKSDQYTWNPLYTPYTEAYLQSEYRHIAPDGRRYTETNPSAAKPGGDVEYEWRVKRKTEDDARWEADLEDEYLNPVAGYEYKFVRPYNGRYWAYKKSKMIDFAKNNHLIHRSTGMPRIVQYADEMPGIPLQDLWDDIQPAMGGQDLGYPTQKPEALLARIIMSSSNEGDIVLDPFCGCGTAIAVSEKLHRKWIGIDVTHLAITLIRHRLHNAFQNTLAPYEIIGAPTDLAGAIALSNQDRYQFQWWALGLVDARPEEQKKGADKGIDGIIPFMDDGSGKVKRVIIQVKSGGVKRSDIATLKSDVDREKAQIGVFITLELPTKPMNEEAATAGFYEPLYGKKIPKIQILTIEDLLRGKRIELPHYSPAESFKKAPAQKKGVVPEQGSLL